MDIFSALADPTRRKILEMLAQEGKLSATEITDRFRVSPPAISQHLKVLREAGLVEVEKRAQQRIYRINPDAMLELEDWARQITGLWNQRFDALERVLAAENQTTFGNPRNNAMTQQIQKEITLTRLFDAPRELVFKAFTDPALLQQWWSPRHFTNTLAEVDLRPGGAFLVNMQGPDGVDYPNKGAYREIVRPERLVFTSSAFEDEAGRPLLEVLNTVTFEDDNGKTKLTLHAVVIHAAPEAEGALAGMEEGWSQSLDKLADLLD